MFETLIGANAFSRIDELTQINELHVPENIAPILHRYVIQRDYAKTHYLLAHPLIQKSTQNHKTFLLETLIEERNQAAILWLVTHNFAQWDCHYPQTDEQSKSIFLLAIASGWLEFAEFLVVNRHNAWTDTAQPRMHRFTDEPSESVLQIAMHKGRSLLVKKLLETSIAHYAIEAQNWPILASCLRYAEPELAYWLVANGYTTWHERLPQGQTLLHIVVRNPQWSLVEILQLQVQERLDWQALDEDKNSIVHSAVSRADLDFLLEIQQLSQMPWASSNIYQSTPLKQASYLTLKNLSPSLTQEALDDFVLRLAQQAPNLLSLKTGASKVSPIELLLSSGRFELVEDCLNITCPSDIYLQNRRHLIESASKTLSYGALKLIFYRSDGNQFTPTSLTNLKHKLLAHSSYIKNWAKCLALVTNELLFNQHQTDLGHLHRQAETWIAQNLKKEPDISITVWIDRYRQLLPIALQPAFDSHILPELEPCLRAVLLETYTKLPLSITCLINKQNAAIRCPALHCPHNAPFMFYFQYAKRTPNMAQRTEPILQAQCTSSSAHLERSSSVGFDG